VIAAINGPAVGIGATMTLPMDIRLASESAKMGFVFTRRAIAPDGCCTWFLPRVVGIGQAAEWLISGRVFSAQFPRERKSSAGRPLNPLFGRGEPGEML